jgi:DNA-binding transcriptional LysR family regulator
LFSPHDLLALVAVADEGSVRGAASALGRTQPAVTQAVRRLEDAVGFALLDRTGYRARFTAQGRKFVERARATITETQNLKTFASLLSGGVEPRLKIVIDSAIPEAAWTKVISPVAAPFSETEIELERGEGDALLPQLLGGQADLAILFQASITREVGALEAVPLGAVEFCTVIRADRLSALESERGRPPQILVVDFAGRSATYGVVEGPRYWRVSDHPMQAALILQGLGWGVVPTALVGAALDAGTLRPVPNLGPLSKRSRETFSLCRRRDGEIGPAADLVWSSASGIERG